MPPTLKIFDYLPDLDCFIIHPKYRALADELGVTEWHAAVWIGRLFTRDNDFGEHWFDNWDLREQLEEQANACGLDSSELMVIDPKRFEDGDDGAMYTSPHTPEFRKRFWTDVLKSLELSYELVFDEARMQNGRIKEFLPQDYIADLETRIERIRQEIA